MPPERQRPARPRRAPWALAALGILLLPLAAPGGTADAVDTALLPPQAAIDALPGAIALAIAEAQDHLFSDQAQARLEEARGFVEGFASLPPGEGALQDPAVRAAYAWSEDVVLTALAIPPQLDSLETAGADCTAYYDNVTKQEGQATVTLGLSASNRLQASHAELDRLLEIAPSNLDTTPAHQAAATLAGWREGRGTTLATCLDDLAQALELVVPHLDAILVPDEAYRTGRVRVLGTSGLAGPVQVTSTRLGTSFTAEVEQGAFTGAFTVPRTAALGNHTVTVRDGDLRVQLVLRVTLAPVTLTLESPTRIALNGTLPLTVTAQSPLGQGEVDRVRVTTTWLGASRTDALQGGVAKPALKASTLGLHVVEVRFPGSDVLAPASATRQVNVVAASALPDPSAPMGPPAGTGSPVLKTWWVVALLLGLLFILALFLSPVWLHRLRGLRSDVVHRRAGPMPWPGATNLVDAVAGLFQLLQRRTLAPPGRTVREWIELTQSPTGLADRFDEVRYGPLQETEPVRRVTFDWVKAQWRRWQS